MVVLSSNLAAAGGDGPWRIALVDDEPEFVDTLAERLRLRGIETSVFLGGVNALAAMEHAPPDVLILDLLMPGLKGLEVLDLVRRLHPATHVIILTGRPDTRDAMECMRRGAFDHLVKPVDIDKLLGRIRAAMASVPQVI